VYLLCTILPSFGILWHYVEFDSCIITTLEKLLGVGSFDIIMGHLVFRHVNLLTSLEGFAFTIVV